MLVGASLCPVDLRETDGITGTPKEVEESCSGRAPAPQLGCGCKPERMWQLATASEGVSCQGCRNQTMLCQSAVSFEQLPRQEPGDLANFVTCCGFVKVEKLSRLGCCCG